MKLLFKQRLFSWFDSYDIYDENGNTMFVVKGQFSIGHLLKIFDANGNEIGFIKQKILTWLPKFEMYVGGECVGCIKKEFTFLRPRFSVDYNGWQVQGNWFEWDYNIVNGYGQIVASVSKQLLNLTDTYVIDVLNPQDALYALMLVLAIDAEKCSRND
ncbi:MAG: LURP-one-related family protein [Clostridia bacterium]|nr:LURP-one-related family protein [Clostridia bacterium]